MYLTYLHIKDHPILKDISLDFTNPKTGEPYSIIAFVGENGCGKTTLLNEIFNYANSKHIVDKEYVLFSVVPYNSLFLRQNSLVRNAFKEIGKRIDGKERYEVHSFNNVGKLIDTYSPMNDKKEGLKVLDVLDDGEILKLFREDAIENVVCGSEISQLIDGRKEGYDISKYSSGQQEILLKLKDLKEYCSGTDSVLLDEPETSLHPRWQREIVNLVRTLLCRPDAREVPQIFLATHSEKVLQSLINNDEALIIRLYKDKGIIKSETISEMDLRLPIPTFAELDYVVFHINSFSYHDELFNYFQFLIKKNSTLAVDEKIYKYVGKWFKEDLEKIEKSRTYTVHNTLCTTNTLPTYIRDYFHHPNEIQKPTEQELDNSVDILRKLIKRFKEK